ncbi:HAUS augmin-like complex subunit 6 [Echeneis naucrates]|uniref:HAUS augmin-like complex subunit 6 N-terminal domain-containing protein n=1 Tax=Echeneis naucrates TaxID=173247 RepID=A0A665XGG6_ECHNA|nr:HAUS augmin-like complex subunit 6 [Echeneis naucrates]
MANPVSLQKKNGKYLWFALLGLGFQPEAALSSNAFKTNINVKYTNLGPNMFDKPNKDAFYIVTNFLLEKLNPTRYHEAYRHCWPVLNHKADAEYRKVTCAWLREIMDETANAGSKVVASLFLSPGGPKFITLMLHLANHVMLQEMKTFTTDDSWVPEAAAMPSSSLDMAVKRLNLISKRFLKTAVEQDCFLQEYQKQAQLLVKSVKDIREEGTKYDELLKRYSSDSAQEGTPPAEKLRKVRSLWKAIDEMLSAIREEQNSVESVLKGDVDQYILDGTDQVLKIPKRLIERIEQLPHQLSSGNVYEAGQLNLLCVLELANHALQILKEERRCVSDAPKAQLSSEHLQVKCQQMAQMLQSLQLLRQKISKEEIPEVRSTIRGLEAAWDKKWMDTLKVTPLVSFLNEDPALGFLSPMAPLSFEPAVEAGYRTSIFSQYPAKLPEEKPAESRPDEGVLNYSNLKSCCPAAPESPVVIAEATSRVNTSLDWLFDRPPSPPLEPAPGPPAQVSLKKMVSVHPRVATMRTKAQIMDMECDNLADQFADAVTTTSPTEGRVKGLDLEDLLGIFQGDPFSTRKQLPRTPENLILDVKSSWRKALEEDKAEKIRRSAELNDSIKRHASPERPHNVLLNSVPSQSNFSGVTPVTDHSSLSVCQQGVLLRSTLLWDTFSAEAPDSPSGTGSSAVQFSLEHETLPEMPSCDSLLSLDDEAVDMKSEEDEELLIPSLKSGIVHSLPNMACRKGLTQQAGDDGSFIESGKRTPECLMSGHMGSGLDRDWLKEPVKSVEASDKVFSLDLDSLETASPSKKKEYSLPTLITFSPIDDMKC